MESNSHFLHHKLYKKNMNQINKMTKAVERNATIILSEKIHPVLWLTNQTK